MTPSNQGRSDAPSRRDERVPSHPRSGAVSASSSGGGLAPAAPRLAAGDPVMQYPFARDEWGLDEIYPIHDGLGADELDIVFTPEGWDDEPEKWPRWTTALVTVLAVVIVGAWFGALAGWWS